jgi:hypothetical protein
MGEMKKGVSRPEGACPYEPEPLLLGRKTSRCVI